MSEGENRMRGNDASLMNDSLVFVYISILVSQRFLLLLFVSFDWKVMYIIWRPLLFIVGSIVLNEKRRRKRIRREKII